YHFTFIIHMQPQFSFCSSLPPNYVVAYCDKHKFFVKSSNHRNDFSNIDDLYVYDWSNARGQINDEIMVDKIVFGGNIWTSIDFFPNLTASKYYFYEPMYREVIHTLKYIKKIGSNKFIGFIYNGSVDGLCDLMQRAKKYNNFVNYLCRLLRLTVSENIQIYDAMGEPFTVKCYTILLSATNTKSAKSYLNFYQN
ncbi:MAG: hypothetical protein O7C59_11060, partial [Rickettsia endosymbiont of Ixodes persulcatus]|nr:hypothetical protein [Rickettsia endosymbiont of Ixodes persulcatus]